MSNCVLLESEAIIYCQRRGLIVSIHCFLRYGNRIYECKITRNVVDEISWKL